MLLESSEDADPAFFRESDLFRKCRELGIIPRSEAELEQRSRSPIPLSFSHPDPRDHTQKQHEINGGQENFLGLHLKVEGMWCPACAWVIEETVRRISGVKKCHGGDYLYAYSKQNFSKF